MTARRHHGGFSLIEIMVSLTLATISLAGMLGLHNLASAANRRSEQMVRGTRTGEEVMEDLRSHSLAQIATTSQYADVVAAGITYHRAFAVTAVSGHANLSLVTVTVTYGEDGDESANALHTLVLQSLRTSKESF